MTDTPRDRARAPDPDRADLTRRETLQYSGAGVAALGLAPGATFLPDPTPRLEHVWMRVREDASLDFVATFESSVKTAFRLPYLSRSEVEEMASRGELTVDLGSAGFDPAPGVPEARTLAGSVDGFVERESGGASGTVYSVDGTSVDAEAVDEQFPIVNPVADVKPQGPGAFVTIEYPDGYAYDLPPSGMVRRAIDVYRRSDFLADADGGKPPIPVDGSPVAYTDGGEYESFPAMVHRADPDLAWLQAVAGLKHDLLALPGTGHSLRDLYRPAWYGDDLARTAFGVARHVGKRFGQAAIEDALLTRAPSAFTASTDVASVAESLEPGWAVSPAEAGSGGDGSGSGGLLDSLVDFFTGGSDAEPEVPDKFQQAADVPRNADWLTGAVDPEFALPGVGSAGLGSLWAATTFERAWNHVYATTDDDATLGQVETLYVRTLEAQREIARQTADDLREAPDSPGADYWAALSQYALDLCTQIDALAGTQIDVLRSS